jgi:hypothetical protein
LCLFYKEVKSPNFDFIYLLNEADDLKKNKVKKKKKTLPHKLGFSFSLKEPISCGREREKERKEKTNEKIR